MPRIMIMVVGVLSLLLAACSPPDVALGNGDAGGSGGSDAPAAVAQPPDEAPFLKGPITSITRAKAVTTDCVSEADADGDGAVSSNDPPVCNPNPSTYGGLGVKGKNAGQGGETEIIASVQKTVTIARPGAGGELEPVEFSDLAKGDVISLWITGPVMESYPLQGEASYILLED